MDESLLPPPRMSWMDVLAKLSEEKRDKILKGLEESEAISIADDWFLRARREQIAPPGDWWTFWLLMAGRGFGKNYAGSNWLIDQHMNHGARNSVIIAATANDLRNYCIEGPSGILSQAPNHFRPHHSPGHRKLIWPNGTETTLISSEKPDRIRGGNFDRGWFDELSYWQDGKRVWELAQFALRLGSRVRGVITMTPRPIPVVKDLLARENDDIVVTRGATYDNKKNLSDNYINVVIKPFEGTSLGRQELEGQLLTEVDGALWDRGMLEACRVKEAPPLSRTVVGIDPAISSGDKSCETGIVVAGKTTEGNCYVLGDHTVSGRPNVWAQKAIDCYHEYDADALVVEVNQGGDLVEDAIRNIDSTIPIKKVRAAKGKVARAEPVSLQYERGKVYHVGIFPTLEDQMCAMVPGDLKESPDRVDALVWALFDLAVGKKKGRAGLWPKRAA